MDIEELKRRLQQRQEIDCGSHRGIAIKYPPLGAALYEMAAVAEAIKVIESLQRELEEARKGADRYEHLRSRAQFLDRNGPGLYWYLPRFLKGDAGEQLDQSIDAARNQKI